MLRSPSRVHSCSHAGVSTLQLGLSDHPTWPTSRSLLQSQAGDVSNRYAVSSCEWKERLASCAPPPAHTLPSVPPSTHHCHTYSIHPALQDMIF
eukprot:357801-Chlamydomonas_euryale.AAC.1